MNISSESLKLRDRNMNKLFIKANGICTYCGQITTLDLENRDNHRCYPHTATKDHIVPVSVLGHNTDSISAIVISCYSCNIKRDRTPIIRWLNKCINKGRDPKELQRIFYDKFSERNEHYHRFVTYAPQKVDLKIPRKDKLLDQAYIEIMKFLNKKIDEKNLR